jgi:diphthamide synthase (EF-2-diphthine--ammonia ligase)
MNATGDNMIGEVIVGEPTYSIENSRAVASVAVNADGKSFELKYKVSEGPIAHGSEAFLAATLLPAMKIGGSLRIAGEISPRLLNATRTIQDILHKWNPAFQKVAVEAKSQITEAGSHQKEVGAFFSGGVDSFYTLLKHQEEITKIIFVHGFDIWLDDCAFRERVSRELREVAAELQKPLIEVETNLRDISEHYAKWVDYFGCGFASVALLLSPQFKKIYIASSESFAHLDPCGSHPLLDPLWGTEHLEIVHDGCEASRNEKVARIATSDIVMRKLRVCYENLHARDNYELWRDTYNCGRCEKCLRTMISLHAVGALEQCKTFNRKLEPEEVSHIDIEHDLALYHVEENLRAIERLGNEPALAQALRNCIGNYRQKALEKEINKDLDSFVNSPWWRNLVSKRKNSFFKAIWEKEKVWLAREVIKESIKSWDVKLFKGKIYNLFRTNRRRPS